ncbi:helix-turn-helix domain-containing protein [Vallitalea sp.]|jgi:transcriptional regulator with XRE-family HTH domain|uniref:helix-turn-helix domain-containing protein n=1 Tax=Vallitalea sp. TaxID=1882829 RepID=UPI0025CF2249|nr:helix-turn-helix transcriptional regulator [Vallitalea sp.]MCT4686061.1 helix-turn-helix domain-containing protein [Vallitalea sp.]
MKNKLGENIKTKRLALDMTLETLANMVGTSRQTVQRYESGVISNIPKEKVEKLALALKTTPASLMGWGRGRTVRYQKTDKSMFDLIDTEVQYETRVCNLISSIFIKGFVKINGVLHAIEFDEDMTILTSVPVNDLII